MDHSTSALSRSRSAVIAAVALLAMAIIAPIAVIGEAALIIWLFIQGKRFTDA